MKAIETYYNGYHFRSRTEARWAVFFDALGWKWEYEKEGYNLPSGKKYLPDFYFPEADAFAEVKGLPFTPEEESKCKELSMMPLLSPNFNEDGFHFVILLDGAPDEKAYRCYLMGEESCPVIFIPKGEKFHPFFFNYDFDRMYFDSTFEAICKSRSARFEFKHA